MDDTLETTTNDAPTVRHVTAPTPARRIAAGDPAGISGDRHRIAWVRMSDLMSTSTGRLAGRGLDAEAALGRGIRRAPALTRAAIRRPRLAPPSAFGRTADSRSREGLVRS